MGRFRLDGIPPARRGVPQVEVSFDIDANGIVNVSAKDKGTGKEQHITITNSSGLSKEEVEEFVKQAKQHEAEDKKLKEVVEKRNHLDNMILSIEKNIKENKEKLPIAEVNKVEKALEEAKVALKEKESDADALQKATDDLMKASHKIAEILYKEQQAKGAQGAGAAGVQGDSSKQQEDKTSKDAPKSDKKGDGPIDVNAE